MKILKTNKEEHKNHKIRESEGKAYIQKLIVEKNKDAYTEEVAKALYTKCLKVIYMLKHGNSPKVGQNKSQLLAAWNAEKNNPIEDNKPRTTEDQSELERLDAKIIQI